MVNLRVGWGLLVLRLAVLVIVWRSPGQVDLIVLDHVTFGRKHVCWVFLLVTCWTYKGSFLLVFSGRREVPLNY